LFSPEALALFTGVLLWWRAIYLGRDEDLHASAQREFGGGTLALAVLFVANKFSPRLAAEQAFWPIILFFALGLGSLALAGFEQDRQIQAGPNGMGLGLNRHWLGLVVGVIGVILVGAIAVAALVSPDSIAGFGALLDIVGLALFNIFATLLYWAAVI